MFQDSELFRIFSLHLSSYFSHGHTRYLLDQFRFERRVLQLRQVYLNDTFENFIDVQPDSQVVMKLILQAFLLCVCLNYPLLH